jgi:hypothetical protein
MKTAEQHQLPEAERNLLANLHLSDEETNGSPVLPAEQLGLARAWLARVLLEPDPWIAHIRQLEHFYQARFSTPLPRILTEWRPYIRPDTAVGFRHTQLLPESEARALAEKGPDDYPPEKLARLLLNPVALWDVSDLISTFLPDYWLPRMDELGRAYMEKHGCNWTIPGEDDPRFQKKEKPGTGHLDPHRRRTDEPSDGSEETMTPQEKFECGLRLVKEAVLDYLATHQDGVRGDDIREAFGLKKGGHNIDLFWGLYNLLEQEGEVEKRPDGGNKIFLKPKANA